jgi:hypothetical protein
MKGGQNYGDTLIFFFALDNRSKMSDTITNDRSGNEINVLILG